LEVDRLQAELAALRGVDAVREEEYDKTLDDLAECHEELKAQGRELEAARAQAKKQTEELAQAQAELRRLQSLEPPRPFSAELHGNSAAGKPPLELSGWQRPVRADLWATGARPCMDEG